jgi:quercetin dioxygenase-like cupin family protein
MSQVATHIDAVEVDPKHYSVELENEKVRVLRVRYGRGEKSEMHSHPDTVVLFVTDAKSRFTFPDGTTQDIEGKAGQVVWIDAMTPLPEALDDPFEVVLIELKK